MSYRGVYTGLRRRGSSVLGITRRALALIAAIFWAIEPALAIPVPLQFDRGEALGPHPFELVQRRGGGVSAPVYRAPAPTRPVPQYRSPTPSYRTVPQYRSPAPSYRPPSSQTSRPPQPQYRPVPRLPP